MSVSNIELLETHGGTASASGVGGGAAANGSDAAKGDFGSAWADTDGSPWWWKWDFGAGKAYTPTRMKFYRINSTWSPKDYTLHGSNNDSTWTQLVTVDGIAQAAGWITDDFSNTTAYRYLRFTIDVNHGAASEGRVHEFEFYEDSDVKKANSIARASLKKINGVAIASVKKFNGVLN